jgi:hypothetical protein
VPSSHGLGGGQAEALVARGRGHEGGAPVEPHELVDRHPSDDAQAVPAAELPRAAARRASRRVVVDEGQVGGGREQRQRLDQRRDALVRVRGPSDAQDLVRIAADRGVGREELRVDPVRDHADALGTHPEVALEVPGARARRGEHALDAARHERLHPDRIELHRADGLAQVAIAHERGAPVDGERVVHGAHDRHAQRMEPEDPPAEALHVVDDVVADAAREARRQLAERARAEREGFGKEAQAAGGELVEVEGREGPQRVLPRQGVAVEPALPELEVREPRDRAGEGHRVRVGRSHEDVDAMAHPRELAHQEPQVHALAAAAHVPAVGDEADPQRPRAAHRFSP